MTPLRVLIVEDEVLVAAEIEFLIEESGMTAVGVAIDREDALARIAREAPQIVLLDLHLADGPTGLDVAHAAVAREGTVVLFMTANRRRLPEDFAGAVGAIAKPYTAWGMRAALRFVSECMSGGEALRPAPSSLELAPAWRTRWRAPEAGHPAH